MPTITDPDADERYAPKIDTQPGTTNMSEFEGDFAGGKSGPIVGNNLRGRENKVANKHGGVGEVNDVSAGRAVDAKGLENLEDNPPDRSGFSAGDDMREKLGTGYTGKGSSKSKGLSKLYGSNSKLKKKIAIAGAAAGGSALLGIIVFLAMLPLKIEHIVDNLESHFSATSQNALDKETQNLYSSYIKNNVLPNLNKKGCHTTVSANCTFGNDGKGPIGKLYNSWNQSKLEQKMATKYGIVIASTTQTSGYHLQVKGHDYKIGQDGDIFNLPGTSRATTNEVRQAVRDGLKGATLYDRVFFRFKLGKLLEAKYGIKRCLVACKIRDNFSDKVQDKKAAAKAFLIQRVISPYSESAGLILQCIIDTCPSTDPNAPDPNNPPIEDQSGDQERRSAFQVQLQSQLDAFAERYGQDALDKLVSDSRAISDKGFQRYFLDKLAEKLGIQAISDKVIDASTPVVGWINFGANLVDKINTIGPKLKVLNYAAASAGAVGLYMSYRTVADEAKSGNMDATELGSFSDQLSSLAKDNNGNTADASATPLYNNLLGGDASKTSSSILSDLFGSSASADSTSNTYKCNDAKAVASNNLVCSEESLNGGSTLANAVSNTANSVPGWPVLTNLASFWNHNIIGESLKAVSSIASDVVGTIIQYVPGINSLQGLLINALQPLFNSITKEFIPSPFSDTMSGGRTFDMMAAGSDVAENKSCQVQLGCAQLNDTAVAQIRNQQTTEQKQEFDSQSMFARMFSTDSQYSLVSQLAMSMPTNMLTATSDGVASITTNPLGRLASSISSIFSGNHAFAATTAQADPFGVVQYGYSQSDIPSDPETYWNQNCADPSNPDSDQINPAIMNQWLAGQDTTGPDATSTGEAVAHTTNPCLLIQSSVQVAGGLSDPTLLPQGSANDTASSGTTTPGTYKNPLRELKNLVPGRIDGGVDYNANPGPIYAVGDGKVISANTGEWPGNPGVYLLYQLTDGPAQGKYIYMAEDCTPAVKAGQTVTADTVICNYSYQGTAMEMGWSKGTDAYLTDDYKSHGEGSYASNSGQDFSKFLVSLGAPSGKVQGSKSMIPMPTGWPTW